MSDTTDDPGDDPIEPQRELDAELVSAYLDGEVSDEERARVDANDALLADVDALRQVRTVLGATAEPPPISVREAHLSATLDVWDRMTERERAVDAPPDDGLAAAAAASVTALAPAAGRQDRRAANGASRWFLGAAAGFILLAGTGLVIRGVTDSGDSTDDFAATAPAADPSDEPASEPEILAAEAGDAFEGIDYDDELPEVADDVAFEEDLRPAASTDQVDSEPAPADEGVAEVPVEEATTPDDGAAESDEELEAEPAPDENSGTGSEADDDVAPGGEADPFPPEDELARLATIEELQDFAGSAAYAPVDAEAPPVEIEQPFNTCDAEFAPFFTIEQFVGPAVYVDAEAGGDGAEQQVVVAIDEGEPPMVIAYRPDDCSVVEQTPLPSQDEFDAGRTGS